MDTLVPLLTTTEGRISRRTWWFGVVILLIASILLNIVLRTLGLNDAWGQLVAYVIMFVPNWSLGIKRRHDRDSGARDFKIFMGLSGVLALVQALGIGMSSSDVAGTTMSTPSFPLAIVFFAAAIYGLYIIIQLGFLRGTTGSNTYGPDPLDGAA
ncbi:DUF805 domain-containing protein [Devosia neptuniae]|jgi:uncharacterized membrane protein YhaH (DUF805 family)|uniref:DUF805 domain-containing protein n=1 Tax=Devosia TaxID=46913 RepID=UPI0022AF37C8|nr:DUF805 domain-containing protein [Devosia neptuniae]MCZ4346941.1 DUF805 domain-containing protein [Devosia neptuniae]|tara:strand:+ start:3695 stop:4159 length:465 start_codon:yes stop_codon:yes gene_type:complete